MELRHLRYFVAVAEEENVTRAAERLHVSQPPLSRQVRDLEDELGVALFDRSPKSIRLTEAGKLFLTEARAVLLRAEEATRAVKALAAGGGGELHVGYAPSLAVDILPRVLRGFQAKLPQVRVTLHDLSTEEMLAGLRAERLEVCLMIEQSSRVLRGFHAQQLRKYGVSVAVSPAHFLARAKRCKLQDVVGERLIGYAKAEYPEYHEWLQTLGWPKGRAPFVAEEHDSVTSLIAAVEAGRGIALAPNSLACLTGPRLTLVPLHPQPKPFVVIAAWRALTPAIQEFLDAATVGK